MLEAIVVVVVIGVVLCLIGLRSLHRQEAHIRQIEADEAEDWGWGP